MQFDITTMLFLLLLGAGVAMLEIAFQFMQQDGQIFMWYRQLLIKAIEKSISPRMIKDRWLYCSSSWIYKEGKQLWYIRLLAYLTKPLGLCPYCNGTWLAILTFILIFGFNLYIFIFIGIVFFFIRLLIEFKFDKYKK